MTITHTTGALAADIIATPAVTIHDILALVDELANVSTPTPTSTIVRYGLLTELRNELRPSLGSTDSGRGGSSRIPLDVAAIAVWETVTARVQSLHEDIEGAPARYGSVEQILNGWARDLVAADVDARTRQEHADVDIVGLSPDALRLMHYRLTRIRDVIDAHFNPGRSGDVPGAQCPVCGVDTVIVIEDGEPMQKPAIGWAKPDQGDLTVVCRNPNCNTIWAGPKAIRDLAQQAAVFRRIFGVTPDPVATTPQSAPTRCTATDPHSRNAERCVLDAGHTIDVHLDAFGETFTAEGADQA